MINELTLISSCLPLGSLTVRTKFASGDVTSTMAIGKDRLDLAKTRDKRIALKRLWHR